MCRSDTHHLTHNEGGANHPSRYFRKKKEVKKNKYPISVSLNGTDYDVFGRDCSPQEIVDWIMDDEFFQIDVLNILKKKIGKFKAEQYKREGCLSLDINIFFEPEEKEFCASIFHAGDVVWSLDGIDVEILIQEAGKKVQELSRCVME